MTDEILVLFGTLDAGEPQRSTLVFLQWARRTPGAPPVRVLAQHTGTAAARVRAVAPTAVIYDPQGWTVPRVAQRLRLGRVAARLRAAELRRRLRTDGPVYVADAAAAPLLHRLAPGAGPVVTHLHATDQAFERLGDADRAVLVDRTDRWLAGTSHQADRLVELGIDPAAITTCADLLDLPGLGEAGPDLVASVRADLRDRHGIPVTARLVVGIGGEDWWTVPDAFVRVAWEVAHHPGAAGIHLLWIADGATERMLWPLRHDIRHAGLEHRVHIDTGDRPAWHHLAAADALVVTRLGDHQPAGHREAVLMGTPVLWFDDPDARDPLVPAEAGTAVRFLDAPAMAEAVVATVQAARSADPDRAVPDPAPWLPSVSGRPILDALRP